MSDHTGSIVTVNGQIEPDELGMTLTHEHTFINMENWGPDLESAYERGRYDEPITLENQWYLRRNPDVNKDNLVLGSYSEAVNEMSRFKREGGSSIIDVTPKGPPGQDPKAVQRVSRETGLNIIQGTAYYVRSGHPDRIDDMTLGEIRDEFVSDVEDGIDDTDIYAGIVGEIGLSVNKEANIYEKELNVLRAGAQAALQTGASLTIHPPGRLERAQKDGTYPTSRWALEVMDIVEEEGLPAGRVVMDHMDRTLIEDLEYQKELAERGAYLEYDLFGSEFYYEEWNDGYPSDNWRVDATIELIKQGYVSNLLFSHDICHKIQRTKYGGNGYGHIPRSIVPLMKRKGVTDEQINKILVENPTEMLTLEDPE